MKFEDIRRNLSIRIFDCNNSAELIKHIEQTLGCDLVLKVNSKSLKGQIFVLMYGAWEFTVHSCLERVIYEINASNNTLGKLQRSLLSVYLHSQIDSMLNSNSKKWEKRVDLFNLSDSNTAALINGYVDVTSGANIKTRQLEIIYKCYQIPEPILPDNRFRGRLDELIENRNAIAHGRESSSTIGGRYTYADIDLRLQDLNQLCLFFISKMEEYVKNSIYIMN